MHKILNVGLVTDHTFLFCAPSLKKTPKPFGSHLFFLKFCVFSKVMRLKIRPFVGSGRVERARYVS